MNWSARSLRPGTSFCIAIARAASRIACGRTASAWMKLECLTSDIANRCPLGPVIKSGFGDVGRAFDPVAQSGARGLVLKAAGGGHVSDSVADAAERAASKVPVVLDLRTRSGCVFSNTYGYVGSKMDLRARIDRSGKIGAIASQTPGRSVLGPRH